ncbi:hypothetical protein HQ590_06770, partial [bacterium]|nr:hypothetical protein [bacterium]
EAFTVEARLDPASRWVPSRARARMADQSPVTKALTDGVYRFELPGQTEPGTLRIAAGDARQQTRVRPLVRPDLAGLTARVEWPVYLGHDPVTRDVASGAVRVLPGSRIGLAGRVSRELAAVTMDDVPLAVDGDQFTLAPRRVDEPARWTLAWRDRFGLAARSPFVLNVELEEDAGPVVQWRDASGVVAILEDELFTAEAVAEDDYGVQQLNLAWEALGNESAGVAASRGRMALATGGQRETSVPGSVRFAPRALGISPQRVILRAQATDYFPGRLPVASPAIELLVLDRLEHAQLVQQELERLQEQFEEILRAEESLFAVNRELRERPDDRETAERLQEQQQGEEANRRELNRLLGNLAELMREALRNKLIPEATLQRWADLLRKLQPVTESEMPAVAQALGQAAQQEGGQRQESLDQALARQEDALRQMLEALQEMNRTSDQLLAENFVNRLRQAARTEGNLGVDLVKLVAETIGLPPDALSAVARARLNLAGSRQARNQKAVGHIRDDLGYFHARTGGEVFQEVHRAMTDQRVVEELGGLAAQIALNQTAQSVEAARDWSRQLGAWADQLADANQDASGSGGGSGGAGASAQVLEQLLRLLRVRQAEEGLREQTRFLDENKPADDIYTSSVDRLRRLQDSLVKVVLEVGEALPDPELLRLLGQVEGAMRDAAALLAKPQTDGATIAAETEVIELLSQSADQAAASQAGGAGAAANAASVLAMLRQMLGMSAGQSGGGSARGGTTDRASEPAAGDATGPGAAARPVEKAVGRDGSTWPAEF